MSDNDKEIREAAARLDRYYNLREEFEVVYKTPAVHGTDIRTVIAPYLPAPRPADDAPINPENLVAAGFITGTIEHRWMSPRKEVIVEFVNGTIRVLIMGGRWFSPSWTMMGPLYLLCKIVGDPLPE